MQVEEYSTLYQLVSVIEGNLHPSTPLTAALAVSLPPGSMTGAPKKRSCELLRSIEGLAKRGDCIVAYWGIWTWGVAGTLRW